MIRILSPLAAFVLVLVSDASGIATAWSQTHKPPGRCPPMNAELLSAPFVFRYGLTSTDLQTNFYGSTAVPNDGSYNDEGYRPIRLTGYVDNGQVRFATKWVRDAGPQWTSRFGLTSNEFHARFVALSAQGYRIHDASGYNTPAGIRYADIWVRNTEGLGWAVNRDVPAAQMDALKATRLAEGLAPTHVEGYIGPNNAPAFIVTWIESPCEWLMEEEMTSVQYQAFFLATSPTMRPVHVDSYAISSLVRFASIFWRQPGPGFRATHGQHWYGFQGTFNRNACDGFVLDNFYGMELPDTWQAFGGIWNDRGSPSVSDASSLSTRVNYHLDCAPGRAGAALINVTTGESLLAHADQWFGSASASKVWTLFALLRKADDENVDLDTTMEDGQTLMALATSMITNSSNSATNSLIDYVTMDRINDELADLGLDVSRVERYYTGGPSAYGAGDWFDDFQAGYDNFTTPRELATFWRLVHENTMSPLSADAYALYFNLTDQAMSVANDALSAGYDPASVTFVNKIGVKSYPGVPGDFAHKPQLGAHTVRSEGGRMWFANGDLVFYAVIVDEIPPGAVVNTLACVGWEAAKEWGDVDPGNGAGLCLYP